MSTKSHPKYCKKNQHLRLICSKYKCMINLKRCMLDRNQINKSHVVWIWIKGNLNGLWDLGTLMDRFHLEKMTVKILQTMRMKLWMITKMIEVLIQNMTTWHKVITTQTLPKKLKVSRKILETRVQATPKLKR